MRLKTGVDRIFALYSTGTKSVNKNSSATQSEAVVFGTVEVLDVPAAQLGECPRWDEESQSLYWVDIDAGQLWHYDFNTKTSRCREVGESIGCFALRRNGGFLLGLRSGYALLAAWDAPLQRIQSPAWNTAEVRFNDGRCDPQGRFWAGTMYEPRTRAGGQLFCLDAEQNFTTQGDSTTITNGIAISLDQKYLFLADTPLQRVFRYRFDSISGRITGPREVFASFTGNQRPDGATVDAAGNYWIALFNDFAVHCYSPSGVLLAELKLPTRDITSVTFGGPALDTLFITTARKRLSDAELAEQPMAGRVLQVKTSARGLIEPRYAG